MSGHFLVGEKGKGRSCGFHLGVYLHFESENIVSYQRLQRYQSCYRRVILSMDELQSSRAALSGVVSAADKDTARKFPPGNNLFSTRVFMRI